MFNTSSAFSDKMPRRIKEHRTEMELLPGIKLEQYYGYIYL